MKYSSRFVLVVAVFITCLIASNIMAVKLVSILGVVLPAAVIIFPISYIFGDILTEVYGYAASRQVIWLGFLCNLLAVVAFQLGGLMPPADFWQGQPAYDAILGYAPRILAASFLAYLVGEFANSFVLAKMKILTKGQWLWTRTIGSTLVGEGLDSLVFISLAFAGTIPVDALMGTVVAQWLFKTGYEIVATPLTYLIVGWLKAREGLDTFDYETDFNPLTVKG